MDEKRTADEILYQLSLATYQHVNLADILSLTIEQAKTILSCEHASIMLWDPKTTRFGIGTSSTTVGTTVPNRVRREGGATRWIVEHNQPLVVPDTATDPFGANSMLREDKIRSYAGIPIASDDSVLGVLYLLSTKPRDFPPEDIGLLTKFATIIYGALHTARMVQELRELDAFKSALIRLLAHDVQNSLNTAINHVELLREYGGMPAADRNEHELGIERSLWQMNKLVEGALSHERLTEVDEMEWGFCDLNEIAREVFEDYHWKISAKCQKLQLACAQTPAYVIGDQLLLYQVVGNLIDNAIKYTPAKGDITLLVQTGDEHLLAVKDTGLGMKPHEIEQLFEPFTRFTSAANTRGHGLGLTLIRIIVERHQGRLTVESTANMGSTFTVRLPALKP